VYGFWLNGQKEKPGNAWLFIFSVRLLPNRFIYSNKSWLRVRDRGDRNGNQPASALPCVPVHARCSLVLESVPKVSHKECDVPRDLSGNIRFHCNKYYR